MQNLNVIFAISVRAGLFFAYMNGGKSCVFLLYMYF